MAGIADRLKAMSEPPAQGEAFNAWLKVASALDFLHDNGQENDFAIYASDRSIFVHAGVPE